MLMNRRLGLALCLLASACSRAPEPGPVVQDTSGAAPVAAPADARPVLLCFGDSLTAGYGVASEEAYPALLQREMSRYRVINAGLSGDTTAGGLDRLPQVLALKPKVVLLELGANDGLRGIPIAVTRANLEQMIIAMKAAGIQVALAGMTLPRNYGADFIGKFEALYAELARKHKLALLRFELEPLAARGLLQADGMHPTAEGYRAALPKIVAGLAPVLAGAP
jgi:acyl-CoA thioesterase I